MSAPPSPDARTTPGQPDVAPATNGMGGHVPRPRMVGPLAVQVCALTDVGRTREHNEDAFLVADLGGSEPITFAEDAAGRPRAHEHASGDAGMLFIVADGLGGAAAGEVASHMAVRAVFEAVRERLPGVEGDADRFATALRDSALAANAAIHQVAARSLELRGMGTTLTAVALLGDTLFLAQVGDSRAYLVRNGEARQLTKDQSLMQRLLDAGEITPEQAETSARRNIILQALGPEPSVKVDITHQTVRRGDLLLLCSDGLSGPVRQDVMAAAARATPDLGAFCAELVRLANEAGGPDNITVVAARFDGAGLEPAQQADAIGHHAYPVQPTPEASIPAVADVPIPPRHTPPEPVAWEAPAPGVPPQELAERRDRARVVYAALAGLAVLLAALWVWGLLRQQPQ